MGTEREQCSLPVPVGRGVRAVRADGTHITSMEPYWGGGFQSKWRSDSISSMANHNQSEQNFNQSNPNTKSPKSDVRIWFHPKHGRAQFAMKSSELEICSQCLATVRNKSRYQGVFRAWHLDNFNRAPKAIDFINLSTTGHGFSARLECASLYTVWCPRQTASMVHICMIHEANMDQSMWIILSSTLAIKHKNLDVWINVATTIPMSRIKSLLFVLFMH